MQTAKDLLTNEEFVQKRINQKFKTPANRIAFYNLKAKRLRMKKAFVDRPLHKSLSVLEELMRAKETAIFHKQFLLGKGFSFSVNTHVGEYEGKRAIAIYSYLIVPVSSDNIKIVRNG